MADKNLLQLIDQGVEVWNKWFRANRNIVPDLKEADFKGRDLSGINLKTAQLKDAKLAGAKLVKAKLDNAYLRRADLRKADLSNASLAGANLRHANMRKCNLTKAYLRRADLSYVDLSDADLTGAVLEYARFVDTVLENASLKDCFVYGASVWNMKGTPAEQRNLVITPQIVKRQVTKKSAESESANYEPTITVDDFEVAQFIYLILNHSKLRNTINAVTSRGVLLLGRFGEGGIDVLREIAEKLRESNYLPIIFDFDRPEAQDYTETVQLLANLSRFVIVDLSGPSVPLELQATIPNIKIPFVSIIEKGRKIPAMIKSFGSYPWWLTPTFVFTDTEQLISELPAKIIAPAEKKYKKIRRMLSQIFETDE